MKKNILVASIIISSLSISAEDGALDLSFGNNGKVTTTFGGISDQGLGSVVQPDGKIVVVGFSNASGNNNFALARYNPDGSLDSSFGTNGLIITNFGAGITSSALAASFTGG